MLLVLIQFCHKVNKKILLESLRKCSALCNSCLVSLIMNAVPYHAWKRPEKLETKQDRELQFDFQICDVLGCCILALKYYCS